MKRKAKKQKKANNGNNVKRVMNVLGGSFLVRERFAKQFPFLVLVTVMLMVLITNTYVAEMQNREIVKYTKDLSDKHVEYIQLKSAIMQASKQSVLSKRLDGTGIKDPTTPVKRIVIENPENEEEKQ